MLSSVFKLKKIGLLVISGIFSYLGGVCRSKCRKGCPFWSFRCYLLLNMCAFFLQTKE